MTNYTDPPNAGQDSHDDGRDDADEADRIVPTPPTTWVVPVEDLLAVLALPLSEQRAAAARTLAPTEWRIWRSLWDVSQLPFELQAHAALRQLGPWAYRHWHKSYEIELRRRGQAGRADGKLAERVAALEAIEAARGQEA